MNVIITCDHCQKQYDYDYIPVMDGPIVGDCSWCGNDVCESCQSKDDEEYHEECLEQAEGEQND